VIGRVIHARPDAPVERVRAICMALPGATERLSHGEAAWFAPGGRQFVTMSDHHHDDRLALWCAAPDGAQADLVRAAPDRFFVPPYVGTRGWLGIYLDVPVDWDEVAILVRQGYEVVARSRRRMKEEG
jgi:predicted DNA-binding protein (MmcQ/YjbR family)